MNSKKDKLFDILSDVQSSDIDLESAERMIKRLFRDKKKRFKTACAAMNGLISNPNDYVVAKDAHTIARISLEYADELLKQENNA